jgi:hypothetical protein
VKRRDVLAAGASIVASALPMVSTAHPASTDNLSNNPPNLGKSVKPPTHGPVRIAFVVGPNTVLIDVAGTTQPSMR